MPAANYERSIGAIIIRRGEPPRRSLPHRAPGRAAQQPHVLLLRYRGLQGGHWDFPRGHVEEGEREHVTARREIAEETGISDLVFLPGFREQFRMRFQREGKPIVKDAVIYLAETRAEAVQISDEHLGYAWLPFPDAMKHFGFENSRQVLRRAADFLRSGRRAGVGKSPPRRHPLRGRPRRDHPVDMRRPPR